MKICIDLGATNVKGACIERGEILQTAKFPTDHSQGRRGIEQALFRTIAALCPERAETICFSSAGDIDSARRLRLRHGQFGGFYGL